MYEVTMENVEQLKISSRMIAAEFIARGYRVHTFLSTSGLMQVTIPGHPMPMRIFSVIDESMSFVAGRAIAGNKQATNALLASSGIPVPAELFVGFSHIEERAGEINAFIDMYGKVVVKPIDGAHGNGVLVGVDNLETIIRHAATLEPVSRFGGFVIQEQLTGVDIRIVCLDGKFASAMTRIPASVVGDGVHTVEELIETENLRPERGESYGTVFNKIDITHVKSFLKETELSRIPGDGEEVQVAGIANVGVGGIRKNIDEFIPEFLVKLAEQVAQELRLPVCGVDFFVDRLPLREDTLENIHPVLIEVNNCPGITMYESFDDPRQKQLVAQLIDQHVAAHYKQYPL